MQRCLCSSSQGTQNSEDAAASTHCPKATLRSFVGWGGYLQAFDTGLWSHHLGEYKKPTLAVAEPSAAAGSCTVVVPLASTSKEGVAPRVLSPSRLRLPSWSVVDLRTSASPVSSVPAEQRTWCKTNPLPRRCPGHVIALLVEPGTGIFLKLSHDSNGQPRLRIAHVIQT